jgi:hypothetical protein
LKDNNHVFPAPRAETLSDMSLLAVLKRMGHSGLTQHGFRSTFRSGLVKQRTINVRLLNMLWRTSWQIRLRQRFRRGTLWPKQVALLDDWAGYCFANT